MSQGQALRVLNEQTQPGDTLVVASGTPHVDVHKLWESRPGVTVQMEVGFSCMGHEIPAAIGARLAAPEAGEVYALIGDGTWLMGNSELVTAVQEGVKVTVLVIENHGYQSIHALQRARTGRSFGLEFRGREQDRPDRRLHPRRPRRERARLRLRDAPRRDGRGAGGGARGRARRTRTDGDRRARRPAAADALL